MSFFLLMTSVKRNCFRICSTLIACLSKKLWNAKTHSRKTKIPSKLQIVTACSTDVNLKAHAPPTYASSSWVMRNEPFRRIKRAASACSRMRIKKGVAWHLLSYLHGGCNWFIKIVLKNIFLNHTEAAALQHLLKCRCVKSSCTAPIWYKCTVLDWSALNYTSLQ